MFEKLKIGTAAALLVGLNACTNTETPQKPRIPENPELCTSQSAYIENFEKGIKDTRFLDFASDRQLKESISIKKLPVTGSYQREQLGSNPSARIEKISNVSLPGGTEVYNSQTFNNAKQPTGSHFYANYKSPDGNIKLSYYDEGLLVDYRGDIKPTTPDNQKVVVNQETNGIITSTATCSKIDFSKK
jgi:hypothetical protein